MNSEYTLGVEISDCVYQITNRFKIILMSDKIRKIIEKDFSEVSGLFNQRKSVEELKWLFRDPQNPEQYNAFVALDSSGRIVGCIGYVISKYKQNEKELNGVIPMSWKILSYYKGMAGVFLMKKVLEIGDFVFTVGGTKIAHTLFPIFKLEFLKGGYKYFKIFNISKFYISLEDNLLTKILKTILLMPAYFKKLESKNIYKDLKLTAYNPDTFTPDLLENKDFHKPLSKAHLSWLLDCPVGRAYAFNIKKGEKNFGVCVFYIKEFKNTCRGRIVYLPFLGKDLKLWRSVLFKSFEFFKAQGCCSISAIATNSTWHNGYQTGMVRFLKSRPIYLYDKKLKLKDIDLKNWNLQYNEGDSAYIKL